MDDTFTILESPHKTSFLEHLNSIDHRIQFTGEEAGIDGSIPFQDVLIIPDEEGNLKTTVYRKPTYTDLYLQWDSNHQVSSKYSVIGSLQHRAKSTCSDKELLKSEVHHIEEALKRCKYPTWALNKAKMKTKTAANRNNKRNNNNTNNTQRPHIVIPYYQGISENMKKACSEYGVQVYFKGGNTIKNLLMAPKDQDAIEKKSGVIYRYQCDRVECDEEYICESSRTFGERFKEHLKAPSPIYDHQNITGHNVTLDNFSIVGREDQNLCRWIKEALYIRVNNPSLNKNIGKYHLPHIWDEVLYNTSELKLK